MMRAVRIGKLLATVLLTLCIGVQVLEATGRWDRTIQDTGDEAVIVMVVLCVGAALAVAGTVLLRVQVAPIRSRLLPVPFVMARTAFVSPSSSAIFCASPPLSLRI